MYNQRLHFNFKPINGVHSIRCNQTCTAFTIATSKGVKVFGLDPLSLQVNLKASDVGSCRTAELLRESNLIALVGGGGGSYEKYDEKSVVLKNMETGEVPLDLTFSSTVLGVRFTEKQMIVVLEFEIHVFKLFTFEHLHIIRTGCCAKYHGLCEVSPNGWMVFPSTHKGHVQVLDLNEQHGKGTVPPVVIRAHEGKIACVAISNSGKRIATASETGTLIRIFDVGTKTKEMVFRRGSDTAAIFNLAFSLCDAFVSVCSDKGTVHIFNLVDKGSNKSSMAAELSRVIPLPESLQMTAVRNMTQFSLPAECPSVLAFPESQTIVAISIDGTFQKYAIKENGCAQKVMAYLLDMGDDFTK
ncbi:WD repeat domain phosphoinositide-interacting protein 4-like [Littorina saxatilis]|uniref:WD repeat domain phosphoinositide-interacting protein 4-like n=1 Tax=Littorina saxatilis TaxID=31220 RepID=UPI0038B474FD